MENDKSVLNEVNIETLTITTETGTLKMSDNPYYYGRMVEIRTDGAVKVGLPLQRFMRHMIDIYGYDNIKKAVDEFPHELRYKTKLSGGKSNE